MEWLICCRYINRIREVWCYELVFRRLMEWFWVSLARTHSIVDTATAAVRLEDNALYVCKRTYDIPGNGTSYRLPPTTSGCSPSTSRPEWVCHPERIPIMRSCLVVFFTLKVNHLYLYLDIIRSNQIYGIGYRYEKLGDGHVVCHVSCGICVKYR